MNKGNKKAYLTIDDSPSKDMGYKVDLLKSKNIDAIWFCRGDLLEKRPQEAIHAIQQGFIIGNHSYSHPHFSDISIESAHNEIEKTDKIIENLYKASDIKRPLKVFRFPYGDKGVKAWVWHHEKPNKEQQNRKEEIQSILQNLGYKQPNFKRIRYKHYHELNLDRDLDCYWTYDVMEYWIHSKPGYYNISNEEDVYKRMEKDDPYNWLGFNQDLSNEIVLLHDHPETTQIFESIIEHLMQKVDFIEIEA